MWTILCFTESHVYSLVFVNLTESRLPWEERTSIKEWPPPDWPVVVSVGHVLD